MQSVRAAILLLLVALAFSSYMSRLKPIVMMGEIRISEQYPYVPNTHVKNAMTVVGFSLGDRVTLTYTSNLDLTRIVLPLTIISPGKTVLVGEHWL